MDTFHLARFLDAQEHGYLGCSDYAVALSELQQGEKVSHWVWYILPQLRDLGRSFPAHYFGISGLEEAKAYLAHPILGARLTEATQTILTHRGKSIRKILGGIDALKFRSCMTLPRFGFKSILYRHTKRNKFFLE